MTARDLMRLLLEADDNIDPRQYLLGTPDALLRQFRLEMERLEWTFAKMTRPTEALFAKKQPGEKLYVWVYVWQGRLHAYGKVEFYHQGEDRRGLSYDEWLDRDIEEIEQDNQMSPAHFAEFINGKYLILKSPDADADDPEPKDYDDADD